MPTCPTCSKEFKNAAGLAAHMRSHQPKGEPEPAAPAAEAAPAEAKEDFREIAREGNFALAACGDKAVLTDLDGKRVSRPMGIDEAHKVFQRMTTARR